MKKNALFIIALANLLFISFAHAEMQGIECPEIKKQILCKDETPLSSRKLVGRGFENILTSPLEIPITVQEYHENAGWPVVRQLTGVFEGTFRTLWRFESGVWDWASAILPYSQRKLCVEPETIL